jgi:hypothetical protein
MNLADLVKTGKTNAPPRICLHGIHGIGKSTWAAGAPTPIFIQTEDGLGNLEVPRFPMPEKLNNVYQALDMLINEPNDYQTVVIDTADWLEKLIWKTVCDDAKVKSIEQIGYGKGYIFAMQHWDSIFAALNILRDAGRAIVVLAHNEIKTYSPPDGDSYDQFVIKLHKHAATKLVEWADIVLFAGYRVVVNSETKKVVNSSERVIHTANKPAWVAKTRYTLPDELGMNFNELITAIKGGK